MSDATNLTRPIIEALYSEALLLADEVRAVFALGTKEPADGTPNVSFSVDTTSCTSRI